MEKDPVIEAYKRDVDRTLLRENLKRTPEERRTSVNIEKLVAALRPYAPYLRGAPAGLPFVDADRRP